MLTVVSVLLLLAVLAPAASQRNDNWIKQVSTLGSSIQFTCSVGGVNPEDESFTANTTVNSWMLPNLKLVDANSTEARVSISPDGYNLTLVNITREDLGIYHCMLKTLTNEWRMVKWGLNMKGPYFENVWEKYRMNVIIGLSAGGGFVVLAAFIWVVYTYRWKAPAAVSDQQTTSATEVTGTPSPVVAPEKPPSYGMADIPPTPAKDGSANRSIPSAAYNNYAAIADDGNPVSSTAF